MSAEVLRDVETCPESTYRVRLEDRRNLGSRVECNSEMGPTDRSRQTARKVLSRRREKPPTATYRVHIVEWFSPLPSAPPLQMMADSLTNCSVFLSPSSNPGPRSKNLILHLLPGPACVNCEVGLQ